VYVSRPIDLSTEDTMVASSLEQLVRNQLLLREVNNRIGEVATSWAGEAPEFLCECSNDDCAETLPVSLLQYEGIRSFPNLFMILPGNETLAVDCIVEELKRASPWSRRRSTSTSSSPCIEAQRFLRGLTK
jgi:hypothetical protein